MIPPADLPNPAGNGLAAGDRRWRRRLRLQPFDTATLEGRSAERDRRIAWSTLTALVARGVSIAVSFITVPLVVDYLGAERYGMWLTISSVVAILGPLDLGVGNGLRQVVSQASGRDDIESSQRAVSTAVVLLSMIALLILVLCPIIYLVVPWADVYNVSTVTAQAEAGPATIVLIAAFAIGLPLSVVAVVQAALQSAYLSSLWAIAGAIASLVVLLLAIAGQSGLPILVAALAGTVLLASLLNGLVYFTRSQPALRPRIRDFRSNVARSLLGTGLIFLVLQLAGLVGYQIDNIVIAQILGPEAVVEYAIPAKLFMLAPMLISFGLMPLWPAYREAIARGDADWVRRTLWRSLWLTVGITGAAAVLLVAFGPQILDLWVGDVVSPDLPLLVGLGLWSVAYSVSAAMAMLLNAANAIRIQAVLAIMMAISNAALSIVLVTRIGVTGAVVGSLVAQTIFILVPFAWYVPRILARVMADARATRGQERSGE